MFNCLQFLKDYNIPTETEGENSGPGWIQIDCPFCSPPDTKGHGGFNLKTGYYNCWRCGKHYTVDIVSSLLLISREDAKKIARNYYDDKIILPIEKKTTKKASFVKFPLFTEKINDMHKSYLIKRNFDPEKIEKQYKIMGTGHLGDYKFRIIVPIYINGRVVSYQGRDVTDEQKERYKACREEEEIIHHKHIVYNIDNSKKNKVIIVEGVTDTWRLGNDCVSLFGIQYKNEQVLMIAQNYREVFVLFDPGEKEKEQAEKLGRMLSGIGIKAEVITCFEKDPAEFSNEEAGYIKKQLIGE